MTPISPPLETDAFRLLVESTTDYAIIMLDPSGIILSWNAGAERLEGYQPHEIIGKHFSTLYPPDAVATAWPDRELESAERDGRFEDEGWLLRKDGSRFWANVIITAIRDRDGTLRGFGKVTRDLTERREAERQLRESEERLRLLVDRTLDYAIFMLTPDGHVASWNAGAERIKGYRADEVIGRHFSLFYPAEAVGTGWPTHELNEAARVGRFEDEGWRVRKDGTRFWANVVITALRAHDGTMHGFAKVTRDMSDRKAQQEHVENLARELERRVHELDITNRELEQKSAENESFVYSVSHDLRSPLVNLQGFSQELMLTSRTLLALMSRPDVPAEVSGQARELIAGELQESIDFIHNAVRHLSTIIDGLLRLSRIGRVVYERLDVDMHALVTEIVAAMHAQIAATGVQIIVHPLPHVRGDRNALGQIFANIIGNSLKSFGAPSGRVIEINATGDPSPVFSIRDNGIGIPAEYQPKIFKLFQHVHDGRTRGEGMGLVIVRRIVERHGGRIWFESSPATGTTFFFTVGP